MAQKAFPSDRVKRGHKKKWWCEMATINKESFFKSGKEWNFCFFQDFEGVNCSRGTVTENGSLSRALCYPDQLSTLGADLWFKVEILDIRKCIDILLEQAEGRIDLFNYLA
jgi:hypothetical protein